MNAWYNEIEPYAAQWTENLAAAGHVAAGPVERRSIVDLRSVDVPRGRQCHFFAGIGGWSRALRLAGWPDDLEVWTGSCPCQPFSQSGKKAGTADPRHLWPTWFDLIREHRPPVVFGEQVASAPGVEWLEIVASDLETQGYSIGAADLCSSSCGCPQVRRRLYFVATCDGDGQLRARLSPIWRARLSGASGSNYAGAWDAVPVPSNAKDQSDLLLLADGIPTRVEQISAYANAIVPQIAATFIEAAVGCIVEGM